MVPDGVREITEIFGSLARRFNFGISEPLKFPRSKSSWLGWTRVEFPEFFSSDLSEVEEIVSISFTDRKIRATLRCSDFSDSSSDVSPPSSVLGGTPPRSNGLGLGLGLRLHLVVCGLGGVVVMAVGAKVRDVEVVIVVVAVIVITVVVVVVVVVNFLSDSFERSLE